MFFRRNLRLLPSFHSCGALLKFAGLFAWACLSASAHGPFDSNARITLLESSIEATAVLGSDLGRAVLEESRTTVPFTGTGQGRIVPRVVAENVFRLNDGDAALLPDEVRVFSDGLETAFVATYPRPTLQTLRIETKFSRWLPASNQCALVVVDDQNRLLASHVVSLSSPAIEISIPRSVSAAPTVATATLQTIPNPTTSAASPATVRPTMPVPLLPISILVALATLGSWWLMRQLKHRETN